MISHQQMARRIVLSLAYADQFEFPLRVSELWIRLIGSSPVSLRFFTESIQFLESRGLIRTERLHSDAFVMLGGRFGLGAQRRARQRFSEQKLLELQPLLRFVALIPWVEAIAITGSVAVENAQLADDTDLLVVTRSGSLWLVRPLLILFAWVAGKRRSWRAEEPNSWCFNLWLESTNLAVPVAARSIYTAHEVLQARWVLDKTGVAAQFLAENYWVSRVLSNWVSDLELPRSVSQSWLGALAELLLLVAEPIWRTSNYILYGLQRLYMQPHKTSERVGLGAAYFHPRDTQSVTRSEWKASMLSLGTEVSFAGFAMRHAGSLPTDVRVRLDKARAEHKHIVLATGVFDILHEEHVTFLEKAAAGGGFLLVGVESDRRVRQIKGEGRPVFSAEVRAQQVAAVPVVGAVVILPDQFASPADHAAFLQVIRPQYLAVSDSSAHLDKKRSAVEQVGGKLLVVHQHNPEVSSTQILAEQASSNAD